MQNRTKSWATFHMVQEQTGADLENRAAVQVPPVDAAFGFPEPPTKPKRGSRVERRRRTSHLQMDRVAQ
jgi:hypothetical protein